MQADSQCLDNQITSQIQPATSCRLSHHTQGRQTQKVLLTPLIAGGSLEDSQWHLPLAELRGCVHRRCHWTSQSWLLLSLGQGPVCWAEVTSPNNTGMTSDATVDLLRPWPLPDVQMKRPRFSVPCHCAPPAPSCLSSDHLRDAASPTSQGSRRASRKYRPVHSHAGPWTLTRHTIDGAEWPQHTHSADGREAHIVSVQGILHHAGETERLGRGRGAGVQPGDWTMPTLTEDLYPDEEASPSLLHPTATQGRPEHAFQAVSQPLPRPVLPHAPWGLRTQTPECGRERIYTLP
jgi:hypothetical protein